MARSHQTRPQHLAQRDGGLDRPRAKQRKKKPFKIVLEAVMQEKRKLRSILTYASNAPAGFGFVPAGHPALTEWCKEQCRQRNLDVHIVSAKPKSKTGNDPAKMSHHVHRVGHHFPIDIMGLACNKFGYTYSETEGLRKLKTSERTNWIAQRFADYSSRQLLHGRSNAELETKDYTKEVMRELFPKIPEVDMIAIVNHAFQEGTKRVGNVKDMALARKLQLAVGAHIRHMYTDYDKLLKTVGWMEAREIVEPVSLAKMKEWRDETNLHSNEIEETFREIIVLDDDDESSSDDDLVSQSERDSSMEIISSRATARDLEPERHDGHPLRDGYDVRRGSRRIINAQPFHSSSRPVASVRHNCQLVNFAFETPRYPQSRASRPQLDQASTRPIVQNIGGKLYELRPIHDADCHVMKDHRALPTYPSRYGQEEYLHPSNSSRSFNTIEPLRRKSDHGFVLPSVEKVQTNMPFPRRATENPMSPQSLSSLPQIPSVDEYAERGSLHVLRDLGEIGNTQTNDWRKSTFSRTEFHTQPRAYATDSSHSFAYDAVDARGRARQQPPHDIIDLTLSSPNRPSIRHDRNHYAPFPPQPVMPSSGDTRVPSGSECPKLPESRDLYREEFGGESSRVCVPANRAHPTRVAPPPDYIPLESERYRSRRENDDARYLRRH